MNAGFLGFGFSLKRKMTMLLKDLMPIENRLC